MFDSRIVRGSTYAPREEEKLAETVRQEKTLRRPPRRETEQERVPTPEPVLGRHHIIVQSDNYLEDLRTQKTESDFSGQTEDANDRPEPPLFNPVSAVNLCAFLLMSNTSPFQTTLGGWYF